jgi:hypothetical protein
MHSAYGEITEATRWHSAASPKYVISLAPIFVTAHPYRLDSAAAMAANKHAALLQLRQRFI